MKRIVLGLAMLSSLALMAAPKANAAALGECGKSYAISIHGTQYSTSNDSGVKGVDAAGAISFNAAGTSGPTGCTVSHLEMIYSSNADAGYHAGANHCYDAGSALGTGVPCFDGNDHQNTVGHIDPLPYNGAQSLTIDPSFLSTNASITTTHLPMVFTVQANTGASTILGSSHPDAAGPTTAPPEGDVLVITLTKQSTTAVLPVTGANPTSCGPYGCSGLTTATKNGYGVAPYLGLSISEFEGFGASAANPFNLPGITGAFGSTISILQIFPNGQAGGSVSFSTNDNVGNTTGVTEDDCDSNVFQTGNWADGTSNDVAFLVHPSVTCGNAAVGAAFTLSAVVQGATDTSTTTTVTGLTDTPDLGGALVPSGDIANALGLSSVPAGKLTNLVAPTSATSLGTPKTIPIKWTNSSPAGCDVTMSLGAVTGPQVKCALTNGASSAVVEGDTPSTQYGTLTCSCTGTTPLETDTATLTLASSNCPNSGATSVLITCKN